MRVPAKRLTGSKLNNVMAIEKNEILTFSIHVPALVFGTMEPIHLAVSRVPAVWHAESITRTVLRGIQRRAWITIDKVANAGTGCRFEAIVVETRSIDTTVDAIYRIILE